MLVSEFRADITIKDKILGSTALMIAAMSGHDDIVHALMYEHQCPIDTTDDHNNTLLHYACEGGSVSLVQTLIRKHNADVNARVVQGWLMERKRLLPWITLHQASHSHGH